MNGYFVFAMALKHALIQCINRKSQSTSYTILLAFAEISRFFWKQKTGFGKAMIKVRDRCGIFVKKERECRMSTPTPLSDPSYFNGNGCYLTHAHNHIMTWVVAAMNSCVP